MNFKQYLLAGGFMLVSFVAVTCLNVQGLIHFYFEPLSVQGYGWPLMIRGLSPYPATVPVPGFDFFALAIDVILGVAVVFGGGFACWRMIRLWPSVVQISLRTVLVVIAIVATWLGILWYEGIGSAGTVPFELARLWVFIAIAFAWWGIGIVPLRPTPK